MYTVYTASFSSPALEIAGSMRSILEAFLPGEGSAVDPVSKLRGAQATATDDAVFVQVASCQPKTPLGKRLMALREEIVKSGAPLLTWEQIDHELDRRRGEP